MISGRVIGLVVLAGALAAGCGNDKSADPAKPASTQTPANRLDAGASKPAGTEKPGGAEREEEANLKLSAEEIKQAGVAVQTLQGEEIRQTVDVTATIQPNRDRLAKIAPRVSGKVAKVMANLGDPVRQGQALAMIDSIEVGEASSAYLQAKSAAALAQSNFERAESLNAEQIIAKKEYLTAASEREHAEVQLHAAEDRLRLLGLAPSALVNGRAISVYALTAPFSGTIIQKDAVLGELAEPETSMFTIADLSKVWIEADIFEKDLAQIRTGSQATVMVSAYPDKVFEGRLTYISSMLDKSTRAAKARIEVNNPGHRLMPEMFATAQIETDQNREALIVPNAAVVLVNGQPSVFVQEKSGFELRTVELGERLGGRIVVEGGVEEGEQIVTSGAYALKARMLKSKIGDTD